MYFYVSFDLVSDFSISLIEEIWADTPWEMDKRLSSFLLCDDKLSAHVYSGLNALDHVQEDIKTFASSYSKGGSVLVKTSTTGFRPITHEINYSLLELVLRVLADVFPPVTVKLADGPAYTSYESECYRLGWNRLVKKFGIKVIDLNDDLCSMSVPGWPIANSFLEADFIINLSKVKTHRRFGISMSYKNLIGVLSGKFLGYPKLNKRHRYVPRLLKKLYEISPPTLSIIDGKCGIEGEGPLAGLPTKSNFVITGIGYIASDVLATIQMGFDPVLIPTFHFPFVKKIDTYSHGDIEWNNFRVDKVNFLPSSSMPWLYNSLIDNATRSSYYSAVYKGVYECWTTTNL